MVWSDPLNLKMCSKGYDFQISISFELELEDNISCPSFENWTDSM